MTPLFEFSGAQWHQVHAGKCNVLSASAVNLQVKEVTLLVYTRSSTISSLAAPAEADDLGAERLAADHDDALACWLSAVQ